MKFIETVRVSSSCELSCHHARIMHGERLHAEDLTNHRAVKIGGWALAWGWALARDNTVTSKKYRDKT